MSYSYTQRRKTIKRFKKKFGDQKWRGEFERHAAFIAATKDGPPIGTLEEIVGAAMEQGKWLK